ncbi:MAG TPA: ribosome-associated translation inhibitor RaiA [Frankiaceae bacterium]|nr:ribosome-associated translation inhibitor RaiA [Frankiaceae bacterium]
MKGRRTEVTERFREHVKDKLGRLEKLDSKAYRVDVELCHESNPRLAGSCDRVELTLHSKGPVVRAEAAAQDPYGALDIAVAKLEERLRRAADRRRTRHQQHHGHASQVRGAARPDPGPGVTADEPIDTEAPEAVDTEDVASQNGGPVEDGVVMAAGPLVVREKAHDATPMSLDDALHRMELVGHDFYLFCDAGNGLPSVVYRRRGYTYGVLRLRADEEAAG